MVCDGFTGNIAMKSVEGCGKTISTIMKREYKKNLWRLICAIMSQGIIKSIKGSMDYEKVGGAMFLGLNKAVVKGHGNSKASAFAICIAQAAKAARGGLVDKIKVMIDDANAKLAAKATEAEEKAEA
jgi:glycerol-3-phosphate acyltransferase PlsX